MSAGGSEITADMMSDTPQPVTDYSERALDNLPPLSVLRAALKPGIRISADSPNRNSHFPTDEFIELGCGNSTSILRKPGQPFVVKELHPSFDCTKHKLVSNAKREAEITMKVFEVFNNYQSGYDFSIKVPGNAEAIEDWKTFWKTPQYDLPRPFNTQTPALQMDMIFSLPKTVGRALIQQFHPKRAGSSMDPYVVEEILNQSANQHCLVQPCLGLDVHLPEPGSFSLANFELSLEDMRNIGANVVDLAGAMGQAFALLHYRCGLSGEGVQFAFGTSPTEKSGPYNSYTVDLYLFGFRDCDKISNCKDTDKYGLFIAKEMLQPNIRKFIPSPRKSPALFKAFKDAYIQRGVNNMADECDLTPHNVMTHYEMATSEFL